MAPTLSGFWVKGPNDIIYFITWAHAFDGLKNSTDKDEVIKALKTNQQRNIFISYNVKLLKDVTIKYPILHYLTDKT